MSKISLICLHVSDLDLFANLIRRVVTEFSMISFSKLTDAYSDDMRLQLAPVSRSASGGSLGFLLSMHSGIRSKPSFFSDMVMLKQKPSTSQESSSLFSCMETSSAVDSSDMLTFLV